MCGCVCVCLCLCVKGGKRGEDEGKCVPASVGDLLLASKGCRPETLIHSFIGTHIPIQVILTRVGDFYETCTQFFTPLS